MADTDFGLKIGLEGEKEFKKSLAEINQSFKVLGSEMKLVSSEFDKNDRSVEALTARNQVLNKEIEAQKQKIDTLRAALQNASESFGENDRRTQNWQIQLNNANAALNDMERELGSNNKALSDAESGFDDVGEQAEEFGKQLEETGKASEDAEGKFARIASVAADVGKALAAAVAAIGAAAVAAGKQLWDMANDVASVGDAIDKTSQKIGISAEAYQEWSYVFERSGADVNNLRTGMKTLATVITEATEGSNSAAEKLAAVGLSVEELADKSQEEQLSMVISALQEMGAGAERTAAANDLLGKSAVDMAAVLNMTAEDTEALKQEAHDYGIIMSDEAVAASAAFEDSLTRLQRTIGGVKNRMIGELLPGITQIMDGLSDLTVGNEGAGDKIAAGVESVIDTIRSLLPQLLSLLSTIAAAVLESAPGIIQSLAQGILDGISELTPVLLQVVTSLVAAITELLPQLADAGVQILVGLAQGLAEALPQLIPAAVDAVTTIVQGLIDSLPMLLDAALQLILGLAQGLLDALPRLIEALPGIINGIVAFLIDAIPQIIEAGIQLLTSLVDALPDIIKSIVKVLPQIITGIAQALLKGLPLIVQAGVDLITAIVDDLPGIIGTIVEALPELINAITDALLESTPQLIDVGITLFLSLIEALPYIQKEVTAAMPQIIGGIVGALVKSIPRIVEVGASLVRGLWKGIESLADWLWDKVSGWISSIWDGICSFFGIRSPSREMGWIGEMLVEGLADSIDKNGRDAVQSAENLAGDVTAVMRGMATDLQTAIPAHIDMHTALSGAADLGRAVGASAFNITIPLTLDGNTLARVLAEIQWSQNAVFVRNLGTV